MTGFWAFGMLCENKPNGTEMLFLPLAFLRPTNTPNFAG